MLFCLLVQPPLNMLTLTNFVLAAPGPARPVGEADRARGVPARDEARRQPSLSRHGHDRNLLHHLGPRPQEHAPQGLGRGSGLM